MKRILLLSLMASFSLLAADEAKPAVKPLPRETQLALDALTQREHDITQKLQGIYEMLMAPVNAARSEEVKRACELVGIKPVGDDGKPACEIRDGKVMQIPSTPQIKVVESKDGGK